MSAAARPRVSTDRGASIQTKENLSQLAQAIFSRAQRDAYDRGASDFETGARDQPPYGFSDLKDAWRMGWLSAKQKADGLGSTAPQGLKRTGAR